ncbi:hypothetical protein GJ496_009490 [Pomphorhynchus laevis]|nr:hypothetical protein GJ496_009490 [Pomphorhynchus laevis]
MVILVLNQIAFNLDKTKWSVIGRQLNRKTHIFENDLPGHHQHERMQLSHEMTLRICSCIVTHPNYHQVKMQNPNEDTEWNDQLRKFGIIPKKNNELEMKEEDLVKIIEDTIRDKYDTEKQLDKLNINQLNELEDELDEDVLARFRQKRVSEMMKSTRKPVFGSVEEITAANYVDEVNNAGKDISVVLHIYQPNIILCNLINQVFANFTKKYVHTKFLRSRSNLCIEKYPDNLLPTVFIYRNGVLCNKLVGQQAFYRATNLKSAEVLMYQFLQKVNAIEAEDIRQAEESDNEDDEDRIIITISRISYTFVFERPICFYCIRCSRTVS